MNGSQEKAGKTKERMVGGNWARSQRNKDSISDIDREVESLKKNQLYLKVAVGFIALESAGVPTDEIWGFIAKLMTAAI